jgi:2-methylcitrate dehydratase PrpD
MLSLGPTELQAAIGLGAEQACGLQAMQTEAEHMNKSFHMGIGSRNGIASAYLAELGYGGVMNVLDSPHSIFDAFVPGEGRPDEVAKALGERFDILDARFKRYASGSPTHTAIASLIGIMEKHDLQASDLSSILVKMPTLEQSLLSGRATLNINLEYISAVAAMDRQVSWEQYSEERQRDPVLQELCRVVTTQGDPEMDAIKFAESLARPAEVTVRTRAGQSYTARMIFPPGSPRNPLGAEELVAKFTTWATRTISPEQAGELRTAVENLEDLADVNELGKLLRLDGGPQAATAAGSAAA